MRVDCIGEDPLRARLKRLIVDTLKLRNITAEKIIDDEPLLGGRIGLDSLDALELCIKLEEEFGLTVHTKADSQLALTSIASLADFIRSHGRAGRAVCAPVRDLRISA